jgi:hypothetical protein
MSKIEFDRWEKSFRPLIWSRALRRQQITRNPTLKHSSKTGRNPTSMPFIQTLLAVKIANA